jgi:hypothetical protein
MRTVTRLLVLAAAIVAVPLSAQRGGVRGLELYAGTNYTGQRIVLTTDTPSFRRLNFNDRAISVRVPNGEAWEVCVNDNFDDCRLIDRDIPDLATINFTRMISSARPSRRGGRGGFPGPGPVPGPRPQLMLYDHPNFQGRSMKVDADRASLVFFNDQAGSVQVIGRWELCEGRNFSGHCVRIDSDVRDLTRLGLNNRISSVRPVLR